MLPQAKNSLRSIRLSSGKNWLCLAACAAALLPAAGRGAITTYTWNGIDVVNDGDSFWSDQFNWNGNTAPSTSGLSTEAIVLTGSTGAGPTLDQNYSINSLTFSSTTNEFFLEGSNTLTIGSGGLAQNSPDGSEINSTVTVDLGLNQTWSITNSSLTMNGALNLSGFGLTVNTAANTSATFSNAISGSGNMTFTGSGTVTLSGTNTYTGNTSVTGGKLSITAGKTGASNRAFNVDSSSGAEAELSGSASLSASGEVIGNSNGGMFNQTGGANTVAGDFYVAENQGSGGTYTLTGDSTVSLSTNDSYVGFSGNGTFIQDGGTHTISRNLVVGHESTGIGSYALAGGALSIANEEYVGYSGTGTFTQSGGTNSMPILSIGTNSGSIGSYTLSGGTLTAGQVIGGAGTSIFDFDGGTLQANQSTTSFMSGFTSANVQSGGAIIDTNGYNITISQSLTNGTGTSDGGLSKNGNGLLTLTGNNSYTGDTNVNAGTLAITAGSTGTSSGTFTINGASGTSATLGGNSNGTGAALTSSDMNVGYALSTGDGSYASSAGDFTQAGGTLGANNVYIGYASDSLISAFATSTDTGVFTQSGGAINAGNLYLGYAANAGRGGSTTSAGTFAQTGGTINADNIYLGYASDSGGQNLTSSTGSFTQTGGFVSVGNLYLGYASALGLQSILASTASYTLNGGTLSVGQIAVYGSSTSTFNFNGGILQANQSTTSFMSGLTTANVQAGGAILDTNGFNITISQNLLHDTTSGAPVTDGGLTKNGNGTLTLTGGNTYTGNTTINAGTLQVGAANAVPANALVINGGTLDLDRNSISVGSLSGIGGTITDNSTNAGITTLSVAQSTDGAFFGVIVDGSNGEKLALNKSGSGTLGLTGNNTYSGGTTITGGTLSIDSDGELGNSASAVTIQNTGQLLFSNSITTSRTFNLSGAGQLLPAPGDSIYYTAATINGGTLGTGTHILGDGTILSGTRAGAGSTLNQAISSVVNFTNVTLSAGSSFFQSIGTLNTSGDFITLPTSNMSIGGTANSQGAYISGALTIIPAGIFANTTAPLYLDGSAGTTIDPAGKISTTGTTIELGGLLINNGAVTGTLDVNFGSLATGIGTYGTINLMPGGTYSPGNGADILPTASLTTAYLTPAAGNQSTSASITLDADTIATVNSANKLTLTNALIGGIHALTKTGAGTIALYSLNAGNLNITQGTVLLSAHFPRTPSQITGLTISPGASLDITDNSLVISYSSSSPLSNIQSYITDAYDHGQWDQPGLSSSFVPADPGTAIGYADNAVLQTSTFAGQSVSTDAILIRYTWLGDANLDGIVSAADLAMISPTGTTWTSGDFNYDGVVNADDYALYMLGAAVGSKTNIANTIPEPGAVISIFAMALMSMRTRRR